MVVLPKEAKRHYLQQLKTQLREEVSWLGLTDQQVEECMQQSSGRPEQVMNVLVWKRLAAERHKLGLRY